MDAMRGTLTGSDLARIRQGCYRVLSSAYRAPTHERIADMQAGVALLEDLGIGMFSFTAPLRRWDVALDESEPAVVAGEYVRLFGSGMDGALCPPIESQQLGINLVGDAARHAGRIKDLMRRSGFEAQSDDRPPDHLVVEFGLASMLCAAEADERASGGTGLDWLELQMELVAVLAMWIPGFADDVAARDNTGAFAALGEATAAFVLHEHDLVRMLIDTAGERVA